MSGKPKSKSADLETIIRLYQTERRSLRDTADALGISHETVRKKLIRSNCVLRPRECRQIVKKERKLVDREKLVELYVGKKEKMGEISKKLKVSVPTLYRCLDLYNIPRREKDYLTFIRSKCPELTYEKIYRLYIVERRQARSIAAEYGYTTGSMQQKLKRL